MLSRLTVKLKPYETITLRIEIEPAIMVRTQEQDVWLGMREGEASPGPERDRRKMSE